jgi:hypothetical protein
VHPVYMRLLLPLVAVVICGALSCSPDPSLQECFGVDCPNQGAINVNLRVERCGSSGQCTIQPLNRDVFLEVIELSGPPEERCGPGNCGGVASALRAQGWRAGRLKIVAPPIPSLQPPPPIVFELEEHEREELTLTYRGKDG